MSVLSERMKWFAVFLICIALKVRISISIIKIVNCLCCSYLFSSYSQQHQATADLSCGRTSQYVQDYIPNYGPLINACQSISTRTSSTEHIKQIIQNMLTTMNTYNRFQPAIKRVMNSKKLTPAEKQKKLNDLQTAIQKFFTDNRATAEKFTTQTNTDAAKLDVMQFIVQCPQIIQNYSFAQAIPATTLMNVPIQYCAELNKAFTTFQNVIDTQRTKIVA